jgi:hypothetical protein
MSDSVQHHRVALVSVSDPVIIRGIIKKNVHEVNIGIRQISFGVSQEVLQGTAHYTEHTSNIQRVCNHLALIIALEKKIRDLNSLQFLTNQCDYIEIKK